MICRFKFRLSLLYTMINSYSYVMLNKKIILFHRRYTDTVEKSSSPRTIIVPRYEFFLLIVIIILELYQKIGEIIGVYF